MQDVNIVHYAIVKHRDAKGHALNVVARLSGFFLLRLLLNRFFRNQVTNTCMMLDERTTESKCSCYAILLS